MATDGLSLEAIRAARDDLRRTPIGPSVLSESTVCAEFSVYADFLIQAGADIRSARRTVIITRSASERLRRAEEIVDLFAEWMARQVVAYRALSRVVEKEGRGPQLLAAMRAEIDPPAR